MSEARELLQKFLTNILAVPQRLEVPQIKASDVKSVAYEALLAFKKEPTRLELVPPVTVVGDLHGQVYDLYRILSTVGLPPGHTYLFLGDLVDRGEFSVATLVLVYVLKILFPSNVFLVRGNHEADDMAKRSGLFQEVMVAFQDSTVYQSILESFDFLPLAASIGPSILCVHGGFGPQLKSLSQIDAIKRPIEDEDKSLVDELMWSDPSEQVELFGESMRGRGCVYGVKAFTQLQNSTGIRTLIRGHECVAEGIRYSFDKHLITVFSASNYCGCNRNKASAVTITEDYQVKDFVFYLDKDIDDGLCAIVETVKEREKFVVVRKYSVPRAMHMMRYRTSTGIITPSGAKANVSGHRPGGYCSGSGVARSLQSLPLMPQLQPM